MQINPGETTLPHSLEGLPVLPVGVKSVPQGLPEGAGIRHLKCPACKQYSVRSAAQRARHEQGVR